MPVLPLFYKNVVPLTKDRHADWRVEPKKGFEFAKDTNSVYVAAVEFAQAARSLPIVFASDGTNYFPLAILGLRQNQNLFLNKENDWEGAYIPAYIRRYPFILATTDDGGDNFTVCIDEDYGGFNKKKGERLFDDEGKNGPILDNAVTFLQEYQLHIKRTEEFCQHLAKLDLLEPMQANIELTGGDKFSLGGFFVVSREKLSSLKQGRVLALFNNDDLELIYCHLLSLNNMASLMERLD